MADKPKSWHLSKDEEKDNKQVESQCGRDKRESVDDVDIPYGHMKG